MFGWLRPPKSNTRSSCMGYLPAAATWPQGRRFPLGTFVRLLHVLLFTVRRRDTCSSHSAHSTYIDYPVHAPTPSLRIIPMVSKKKILEDESWQSVSVAVPVVFWYVSKLVPDRICFSSHRKFLTLQNFQWSIRRWKQKS